MIGALDLARHFTNNRFRESAADRGKSDEDCRSDLSNHVGKSDLTVRSPGPSGQTFLRLSIDGLFGGQIFSP